eukprot:TRINITY_DN7122_c1_g1_i1.p1 TRINITY_DN7122_c1_g1~~TRINITY_DN7122_c1_g1_i1.p1  ORF type:complete len:207 (+),score=32.90 TRINITY_DN7122_c1_g1_i1:33-623(+)
MNKLLDVPPELEMFNTNTLRYIKVCDKVNHKLSTQKRVLLVTTLCVFVCTTKGDVKRFVPFGEITKVVMAPDAGITQVLFKLREDSKQHDILLRISGEEMCTDLRTSLNTYSLKPSLVEVLPTPTPLAPWAQLSRRPDFKTPKDIHTTAKASQKPLVIPVPIKTTVCPLLMEYPGFFKVKPELLEAIQNGEMKRMG